jgi:hypothetical protein
MIGQRPAVKRGRNVNRLSGHPADQLHERARTAVLCVSRWTDDLQGAKRDWAPPTATFKSHGKAERRQPPGLALVTEAGRC